MNKYLFIASVFISFSVFGDGNLNDPFDIGDAPLDLSGSPQSTASTYNLSSQEIDELIIKSKSGDKESSFRLYQYYEFVKLDVEQGKNWLQKSADQGHEVAKSNLDKKSQND